MTSKLKIVTVAPGLPYTVLSTPWKQQCLPTSVWKKGVCDPSIHKIRYTRLPPLKKFALISKTNENLKLLNPCTGNLHNNYNIAKTVGEDSKTNPCQLNKYNSVYSKNSCCFYLIKSGLHFFCLTRQLIQMSTSVPWWCHQPDGWRRMCSPDAHQK